MNNVVIAAFVAKLNTLAIESYVTRKTTEADHTPTFIVERNSRWATIRRSEVYTDHVIGGYIYAVVALQNGSKRIAGVDFEFKAGDVFAVSLAGKAVIPVLGSIYAENIKAFTGYYTLANPFEIAQGRDCWEQKSKIKFSDLKEFEGGYSLKQA